MNRTTSRLTRVFSAVFVAAVLVPTASVASPGGGAYGQHLSAPAQTEIRGGGAYGQHVPAATQTTDSRPALSSDSADDLAWGDVALVAGGVLLLIGLGGTVVAIRRRGAVQPAA